LADRVPVPDSSDEISALAVTMNEMLARLEASHRAQQRFVGDASHELRSPLTTIISGLEAAEDHPELLDTGLASTTLLPEAHRMRTLIEDLLLLARADEQRLVARTNEVSVSDVAEAEVARARQNSCCTIDSMITPVRIVGDSTAISRVVRNLLDNAIRHATSRVEVCVGDRDGAAIIAISDDGPGIAREDRTRVFERFVRLDSDRSRSSGGAGLGLAIVAEVVAAHGGIVTVEGPPGRGTTMQVSLPQHTSR
jgi:signal transduction histidine kinase